MGDPKEPGSRDVALVYAPTEDGQGAKILRSREGTLEAGEIRPMKDGAPITGEIVRLTPRADAPCICDVDVLHDPKKPEKLPESREPAPAGRPARVATSDYRANWDRIFDGGNDTASAKPPRLLN